jgi:hypothetical protein
MMEVTMETPKDIQQQIKLTQQKLQAAVDAPSAPRIEAPNPLPAGFKECRKKIEIDRKASRPLSSRRVDRFEESLYWLLSAATLIYLLLGIIGR